MVGFSSYAMIGWHNVYLVHNGGGGSRRDGVFSLMPVIPQCRKRKWGPSLMNTATIDIATVIHES